MKSEEPEAPVAVCKKCHRSYLAGELGRLPRKTTHDGSEPICRHCRGNLKYAKKGSADAESEGRQIA